MRYLLLTLLIALLALPAGAAPKDPEADLKRVKQRIEKLQRSVREDVARRDKLSANLRESEEAVAAARRRLDDVRGRIRESDERLAELAGERTRAEKTLEEQRDQLAAALRTAYVTGKEEHLKLLLSQKDPAALGRMLVYYSYLGKARAGSHRRDRASGCADRRTGHRRGDGKGEAGRARGGARAGSRGRRGGPQGP